MDSEGKLSSGSSTKRCCRCQQSLRPAVGSAFVGCAPKRHRHRNCNVKPENIHSRPVMTLGDRRIESAKVATDFDRSPPRHRPDADEAAHGVSAYMAPRCCKRAPPPSTISRISAALPLSADRMLSGKLPFEDSLPRGAAAATSSTTRRAAQPLLDAGAAGSHVVTAPNRGAWLGRRKTASRCSTCPRGHEQSY